MVVRREDALEENLFPFEISKYCFPREKCFYYETDQKKTPQMTNDFIFSKRLSSLCPLSERTFLMGTYPEMHSTKTFVEER